MHIWYHQMMWYKKRIQFDVTNKKFPISIGLTNAVDFFLRTKTVLIDDEKRKNQVMRVIWMQSILFDNVSV